MVWVSSRSESEGSLWLGFTGFTGFTGFYSVLGLQGFGFLGLGCPSVQGRVVRESKCGFGIQE